VVGAIGTRTDVVLVAGSLGGFIAPLVCERATIRELVLVYAMIPGPGETACDEPYQRSEADIARWSVCDFAAWPAFGTRVDISRPVRSRHPNPA
jgi:hypothetical protein